MIRTMIFGTGLLAGLTIGNLIDDRTTSPPPQTACVTRGDLAAEDVDAILNGMTNAPGGWQAAFDIMGVDR